MKKHLDKIIAIALASISLAFIIMLLVVSFSPRAAAGFNNLAVQVIVLVLAVASAGGSAFSVYKTFIDKNRVNRLLVSKSGKDINEVSIKCVKSLAKQAVSAVKGAYLKNISICEDEKGEVTFKACLVIKPPAGEEDTLEKANVILAKVRAALEIEFKEVFDLEFDNIILKLTDAKAYNPPTQKQIDDRLVATGVAVGVAGVASTAAVVSVVMANSGGSSAGASGADSEELRVNEAFGVSNDGERNEDDGDSESVNSVGRMENNDNVYSNGTSANSDSGTYNEQKENLKKGNNGNDNENNDNSEQSESVSDSNDSNEQSKDLNDSNDNIEENSNDSNNNASGGIFVAPMQTVQVQSQQQPVQEQSTQQPTQGVQQAQAEQQSEQQELFAQQPVGADDHGRPQDTQRVLVEQSTGQTQPQEQSQHKSQEQNEQPQQFEQQLQSQQPRQSQQTQPQQSDYERPQPASYLNDELHDIPAIVPLRDDNITTQTPQEPQPQEPQSEPQHITDAREKMQEILKMSTNGVYFQGANGATNGASNATTNVAPNATTSTTPVNNPNPQSHNTQNQPSQPNQPKQSNGSSSLESKAKILCDIIQKECSS